MRASFLTWSAGALAAALFALSLRTGPADAGGDPYGIPGVDYVDGRVLVAFVPGTPGEAAAAAHAQARARVVGGLPSLGVQIVDVGPGRVPEVVRAYLRNPNVRFAEPDLIVRAAVDCTSGSGTFANDPCAWRQWGRDNEGQNWGGGNGSPDADVDVPEAWAAGARGSGVIIAVLDTGYDTTHEDVAGRLESWADFTGSGIEDRHGHGTWTASIAAAAANNGTGIAGAAPEARLIVGKVLGDDGSGSWSQVAAGITWAADYGARPETGGPTVISMSLGGSCTRGRLFLCSTLQAAVEDAEAKGALLIAAAGNSGKASPEYPGAFEEVLAVAATDDRDAIAGFSNAGEIAAPGVSIFGAFPDCAGATSFRLQSSGIDCGYDYGSGTSAATPIAAGAAALVWSASPSSWAADVRNALTSSAQDIAGTSYDGAGRLTACGALAGCSESWGGDGTGGGGGEPPAGYVVDLTGSASNQGRTWTAQVTIAVASGGTAAQGVTVDGSWSTGEAASCTTGPDGTCTVSLAGIPKRTASVTFTVASVGGSGDFGGETSVTVAKP